MEVTINQLMEMTGKSFRSIKSKISGLKPVREDGRAAHYECKDALKCIYGLDELAEQNLREQRGRADKIEIEVQKMRGELIPLSEIGPKLSRQMTNFRSRVRSLSSRLAKPLAIITDPRDVQSRLDEAIDECLSELTADAEYQLESDRVASLRATMVQDDSDGLQTESETEPGGVGGHVQVSEPGEQQHSGKVENGKRRGRTRSNASRNRSTSREAHSNGTDSALKD